MVMSNELSTPKVTYCPSDSYHSEAATEFSYNNTPQAPDPIYNPCNPPMGINGVASALTKPGACSYFVNGDGSDVDPQIILAGDENIGRNTTANGAGTYGFTYTSPNATGPALSYSSYFGQTFQQPFSDTAGGAWAWTGNDFHQKSGNILLGDGSVQSVSISGLHEAMRNSTNSITTQSWNFPR